MFYLDSLGQVRFFVEYSTEQSGFAFSMPGSGLKIQLAQAVFSSLDVREAFVYSIVSLMRVNRNVRPCPSEFVIGTDACSVLAESVAEAVMEWIYLLCSVVSYCVSL